MAHIVFEVRATFGTVLFNNVEAAKAYVRECQQVEPEPFAGLGKAQGPIIAPRVVLDSCPTSDLSLAS